MYVYQPYYQLVYSLFSKPQALTLTIVYNSCCPPSLRFRLLVRPLVQHFVNKREPCPCQFMLVSKLGIIPKAISPSCFVDLLRDEKTEIDLVGPTLPSLKAMLENPPTKDQPEALAGYSGLVHGLLSSCLVNIDEMRYVDPFIFWSIGVSPALKGGDRGLYQR